MVVIKLDDGLRGPKMMMKTVKEKVSMSILVHEFLQNGVVLLRNRAAGSRVNGC